MSDAIVTEGLAITFVSNVFGPLSMWAFRRRV